MMHLENFYEVFLWKFKGNSVIVGIMEEEFSKIELRWETVIWLLRLI